VRNKIPAREPSCDLARAEGIGHSIAMSAAARKLKHSPLIVISPLAPKTPRSGHFVKLADLRKHSECEQVAAVCYRLRRGQIEFLLVRTRGSGRWTFPKGSAEPGLTQAQAAALEAFEEAGVHGRIEEASFTRYTSRRPARKSVARSLPGKVGINAFLCEVTRLCPPKEARRNRTWFSAPVAKLELREGRERAEGASFARVVDRAVARIQIFLGLAAGPEQSPHHKGITRSASENDALRKVQFEGLRPGARFRSSSSTQISRPFADAEFTSELTSEFTPRACGEVLPFTPPLSLRGPKLLLGAKRVKSLGTRSRS
jgi:8-oxo-dGTP pyrophosphatase MutT (NUDIX family)